MAEAPPEVWGTCAVNDHLRSGAFVRELLLFDRLVVPYPDTEEERERWMDPNPADPLETWDPDRLDELLKIIGTQHEPGHEGARCAWTVRWSQARWHAGRTRRELADVVGEDPFMSTRRILTMGEDLPTKIEAVASYPTERAWWQETQPAPAPAGSPTPATALVALARPLLLPRLAARSDEAIRDAVELACDKAFRSARTEYHQLVRRYVGALQRQDDAAGVEVTEADFTYAREKLLEAQKEALGAARCTRWTVAEWAMMIVGTAAQAALATAGALPVIGAGGPIAQFAGFIAGRMGNEGKERLLNGASMFVTAEKELGT